MEDNSSCRCVLRSWEPLVLGLVLLNVLVPVGRGFGPYWDTWFYHDHSMRWSAWLSSWWDNDVEAPSLLSNPRFYFPDEKRHPPLLEWAGGFFHSLFAGFLGEVSAARLSVETAAVLWSVASYLFLAPRIGKGPAVLGIALFWGSPRFLLHSVLFAIDGLIASIYGLTLLSFLFWEKGWKGKGIVWGMLVLSLLTKLHAFFLFPILIVWAVLSASDTLREDVSSGTIRIRKELFFSVVVLFLAVVAFFVLWPALWLDFPKGILDYLDFITRHSNVPVLYFGKVYKGDQTPPWHYPLVFTLIALPLTLTVPVLVRVGRWTGNRLFTRDQRIEKTEILLWVGMLVPLLVSSLPQAPKYDGIRLLLPAYGPFSLLAGLELGYWWKSFEKQFGEFLTAPVRKVLLAAIVVGVLLPSVRIYPFNIVYYSPLIGGTRSAREKGFDLDYLGVSLHRLNPAMNRYLHRGDILLLAGCNALVGKSTGDGWVPVPAGIHPVDFKLIRQVNFKRHRVFAVISSRYDDLNSDAWEVLRRVPPLDVVSYRGERLFSLHRITPEFVRSLPKQPTKSVPGL